MYSTIITLSLYILTIGKQSIILDCLLPANIWICQRGQIMTCQTGYHRIYLSHVGHTSCMASVIILDTPIWARVFSLQPGYHRIYLSSCHTVHWHTINVNHHVVSKRFFSKQLLLLHLRNISQLEHSTPTTRRYRVVVLDSPWEQWVERRVNQTRWVLGSLYSCTVTHATTS